MPADIQDILVRAGDAFVQVQETLDLDNCYRLLGYLPIWRMARPLMPQLADDLIPSTRAVTRMSVDVEFQFTRTESRETAVEVALLNIGYSSRFEQSRFGRCSLQFTLNRVDQIASKG